MSRTVFYISLLFIWPSWLVTVAKKKSVKFFIYFWGIGYRMPFKGPAAGRHRWYREPRWHSRPMDVNNNFFFNLNFNLVSAEGTKGIFSRLDLFAALAISGRRPKVTMAQFGYTLTAQSAVC